MVEELIVLPDQKGGQLKFRIDEIDGFGETSESIFNNGDFVDIFAHDGKPNFFCLRNIDIHQFNHHVLTFGRPKGFGQVLWRTGSKAYQVLWTPYISDEGYFDD